MTRFRRLLGGEPPADEAETVAPSHVCQSCGEEYFAERTEEIHTCHRCGGVKVEST